MSHDYTIYKYNTLLFRIKTYMIFVQMNFYIIFQTVLINLFEVGFFSKKDASWFSSQIYKIRK